MDPAPLQFIARACAGKLRSGSSATVIHGVCTDSRRVQAGDVFFALSGERFDGHSFLPEVVNKAAAVVVRDGQAPAPSGSCAVIAVAEPRKALGRLAAEYRKEFELPMVARRRFQWQDDDQGTNRLGAAAEVDHALERGQFQQRHRRAVDVAGLGKDRIRPRCSKPARIIRANSQPLVQMIEPTYGVITCIGREHLEFFGDLAGVSREEGWLAELLPSDGKLFLNGDAGMAPAHAAREHRASVVRVGLSNGRRLACRRSAS